MKKHFILSEDQLKELGITDTKGYSRFNSERIYTVQKIEDIKALSQQCVLRDESLSLKYTVYIDDLQLEGSCDIDIDVIFSNEYKIFSKYGDMYFTKEYSANDGEQANIEYYLQIDDLMSRIIDLYSSNENNRIIVDEIER